VIIIARCYEVHVYEQLSDYHKPRQMAAVGKPSFVLDGITSSGFNWCDNCYSTTVEVATLAERWIVHDTASTEDATYVKVRGMLGIDQLVEPWAVESLRCCLVYSIRAPAKHIKRRQKVRMALPPMARLVMVLDLVLDRVWTLRGGHGRYCR
jgi:hypothetical protein